MEKNQSSKQQAERSCFGTKEWSKTSGICRGCELRENCGKINAKRE